MNKINITPENFERLNNDVNGNPKYYISVADFFAVAPETLSVIQKANYIDKIRKGTSLYLYRGKKYGSGYTIQSYNLQNTCDYLNEYFNSNDF